MTKPYSIDLRERAVARVSAGESVRSVAAVLSISASSVVKWAQRERTTGSVAPGQIGGHRPRVLVGEHRDWTWRGIGELLNHFSPDECQRYLVNSGYAST